jgi:putative oxidoreductase
LGIKKVIFNGGGNLLEIIGRFVIGSTFVIAGLRHINPQTFASLAELLAARSVPFPRASLAGSIIVQIFVGLAFALGIERYAAGAGLIIFTFSATVIGHNFWDKSGQDRTADLLAWQANSAIVGGLLLGMV